MFGRFLVLAGMPAPQAGWCQQYDYDMAPIRARKFEPPAVTGRKKYPEPIPRALEYLRRSLLPDGPVLRTGNQQSACSVLDTGSPTTTPPPRVTTAGSSPPGSGRSGGSTADTEGGAEPAEPRTVGELEGEVRRIIRELDGEGRWVTTHAGQRLVGQPGFGRGLRYVSSDVFSRNVEALSRYLAPPGR